MLKQIQRKAIALLARGHTQIETAKRIGVSPKTVYNWRNRDERFKKALAAAGDPPVTELETLSHECLLAVMKELRGRLQGEDIREIAAKDLLTILDRVGKLFTPSASAGSGGVYEERPTDPLLELLNHETRRELYQILVRRLRSDETDFAD